MSISVINYYVLTNKEMARDYSGDNTATRVWESQASPQCILVYVGSTAGKLSFFGKKKGEKYQYLLIL